MLPKVALFNLLVVAFCLVSGVVFALGGRHGLATMEFVLAVLNLLVPTFWLSSYLDSRRHPEPQPTWPAPQLVEDELQPSPSGPGVSTENPYGSPGPGLRGGHG